MKYLLFGDIHGKSLEGIERLIERLNPKNIICLGDFDQVKPIRQVMELERKYKNFLVVPGNHDYAVLTKLEIISGTLLQQGKNTKELYKELKKDKEAYSYIERLVTQARKHAISLNGQRTDRDYHTIVMHGAYDGDWLAVPQGTPEKLKEYWFRLETEEDHRRNFQVMRMKQYKIMIRGHDHNPGLAWMERDSISIEDSPKYGKEYPLERNKRHTITVGAWCNGNYALITSGAEPKVIFQHLNSGHPI